MNRHRTLAISFGHQQQRNKFNINSSICRLYSCRQTRFSFRFKLITTSQSTCKQLFRLIFFPLSNLLVEEHFVNAFTDLIYVHSCERIYKKKKTNEEKKREMQHQ